MAEQKRPVQPVKVVYICDNCGAGEMENDGITLTTWPAQHPHTCNRCGYKDTFRGKSYPYIDYIDPIDIANDLARQTLELPTRAEHRAANEQALQEISDFVGGKLEIHY